MACKQSNQQHTFCRVNAHFQKGIAESTIQDLSRAPGSAPSRMPALAACGQHCPLAICPSLCHSLAQCSPSSQGWKVKAGDVQLYLSWLKHEDPLHIWCPVLALHHALAGGKSIPRWDPRLHIRLYLGPSPLHACNASLVLSLTTGFVSLQFHCCFEIFLRHASMEILTWASPQHGSIWQDSSMQMGTRGFSQIRDSSVVLQSAKWAILLSHSCPRPKSCHLNHKMRDFA
jgi:hypothetical protein